MQEKTWMPLKGRTAVSMILVALLINSNQAVSSSVNVPSQVVWRAYKWESGHRYFGHFSSQSEACQAATPQAVEWSNCTTTHEYSGTGGCDPYLEFCGCAYEWEKTCSNPVWNDQGQFEPIDYTRRDNICPPGLNPFPNDDFPTDCVGVPDRNRCPQSGNPISTLTGVKREKEIDYVLSKDLVVERTYASSVRRLGPFGFGWSAWFVGKKLLLGTDSALLLNPAGTDEAFQKVGSDWESDPDSLVGLTESASSFEVVRKDDTREVYDQSGNLQSITERDGRTLLFSGSPGSGFMTVTDHAGHSLTITFDAVTEQVTDILASDGFLLRYEYDQGVLQKVIFPDGTPGDPGDNPFRLYHYEKFGNEDQLVGITDEEGVRYVTWNYDAFGKAISSTYTGEGTVSLDYTNLNSGPDFRVVETNEFNKQATYHYQTVGDQKKIVWIESAPHTLSTDPSVSCANKHRYYKYNSDGRVEVVVDWDNKAIAYQYDTKGREDSRREGLTAIIDDDSAIHSVIGTSVNQESRQIETQWHDAFRLPRREILSRYDVGSGTYVAEKVTDYAYDCTNGRLQAQQVYGAGDEPLSAPYCP